MSDSSLALLCRLALQGAVLALGYSAAILAVSTQLLPLLLIGLLAAALHHTRRPAGGGWVYGTARWADCDDLASGFFAAGGLLLGRFAALPSPQQALRLLFTLPAGRSAAAVRLFFAAFNRRSP